jgi:hypothetical protein
MDDKDGQDRRFTASLAGLAIALLLAVLGVFLVQKLSASAKLQDCLMQGRSNCAPIDAPLR